MIRKISYFNYLGFCQTCEGNYDCVTLGEIELIPLLNDKSFLYFSCSYFLVALENKELRF